MTGSDPRRRSPGLLRMKIIFAGTIGRSGLDEQAWASLQYLLGFRALGHEVFYLKDCGDCSWVYDWEKAEWTFNLAYPATYVGECLEPFGFCGKWIYRTNSGSTGAPLKELLSFCEGGELLVMRGVPLGGLRKEYG